MEKWFEIHWKDGTIEYIKGLTEESAFENSCIREETKKHIDYYCEVEKLPLLYKEVYYVYKNGNYKVLDNNSYFVKQARNQIREGKTTVEIVIGKYTWNCLVKVEPFNILLKDIDSQTNEVKGYVYPLLEKRL